MTEVLFLKILWFVAGIVASTALTLGQDEHTPWAERLSIGSIPLIIFTVMYVFARAISLDAAVSH